ncbi:hypothetical protein CMUS01_13154 [Colletotrichum musicola]|uniref:Nuclear pore protein n=1 Tax=Colletotrichum musicola TaxID=2175873 RepID=A0A8H6JGC0_9PEZI|nr:hypothetical protein CMUS01_13154 [Colletotrichum musicola]
MTDRDVKRRRLDFERPKTGVTIDEDGDLLLRALALATDAKQMLFGGFKETRPAGGGDADGCVVDLPEDDAIDFKLFLDIIHGWVAKVPAEPTSDVVAGLVLIAAKYDAIALFRPYADRWTDRLEDDPSPFPGHIEFTKDALRALYVNWEFGHAWGFRSKFLSLIWHIRFDDEVWGVLVRQDQQMIDIHEHLDSNGIIHVHHIAVTGYLTSFRDLRDDLVAGSWCTSRTPRNRKKCTSMLLGSLLAELINKDVPLVDTPEAGWDLGGEGTWTLTDLSTSFSRPMKDCARCTSTRNPATASRAAWSCQNGGWDDRIRPRAKLLGLEFLGQAELDAAWERTEKKFRHLRTPGAGRPGGGIEPDSSDSFDNNDNTEGRRHWKSTTLDNNDNNSENNNDSKSTNTDSDSDGDRNNGIKS